MPFSSLQLRMTVLCGQIQPIGSGYTHSWFGDYLIWYDPGDGPVGGACFDGGVLQPPYCSRELPPHPKPRQSRQHLEQLLVVLFSQVLKQLWRSASHQGTAVFMAGV